MEFVRPKRQRLGLDMAPLIDIVFLLLIFFMLSSSFLQPSLKLNLPQAVEQAVNEKPFVFLNIDQNERVYVNREKSSKDSLLQDLTAALEKSPEKTLHFRGDREIPYSRAMEALDTARRAGAERIHLVHEKSYE